MNTCEKIHDFFFFFFFFFFAAILFSNGQGYLLLTVEEALKKGFCILFLQKSAVRLLVPAILSS